MLSDKSVHKFDAAPCFIMNSMFLKSVLEHRHEHDSSLKFDQIFLDLAENLNRCEP